MKPEDQARDDEIEFELFLQGKGAVSRGLKEIEQPTASAALEASIFSAIETELSKERKSETGAANDPSDGVVRSVPRRRWSPLWNIPLGLAAGVLLTVVVQKIRHGDDAADLSAPNSQHAALNNKPEQIAQTEPSKSQVVKAAPTAVKDSQAGKTPNQTTHENKAQVPRAAESARQPERSQTSESVAIISTPEPTKEALLQAEAKKIQAPNQLADLTPSQTSRQQYNSPPPAPVVAAQMPTFAPPPAPPRIVPQVAAPAPRITQLAQNDSPPVQRVEITGSTIRRMDAETPSPVQVIASEQIKSSGHTSVSNSQSDKSAPDACASDTITDINAQTAASAVSATPVADMPAQAQQCLNLISEKLKAGLNDSALDEWEKFHKSFPNAVAPDSMTQEINALKKLKQ